MRSSVINRYRNIGQRTDQTHGIHGTELNNRGKPWLETQGRGKRFPNRLVEILYRRVRLIVLAAGKEAP